MSFHSPISDQNAGCRTAQFRRVRCDLAAELPVTTEELDLLVAWLGDVVADISGRGEGANDISKHGKEKK